MVVIVRQDNFFLNTGVKICGRKGYMMQGQTIYIKYKDKALIRKRDRYLSGPTAIVVAAKKSCWQK